MGQFKEVVIQHGELNLQGHLYFGEEIKAWIVFAHGSGSSRNSKRNNWVAQELSKKGFGTLLFDLLTAEEDSIYLNRFDISLLSKRLKSATTWLMNSTNYRGEQIGYFGASTGAAAALVAAAEADSSWPIFALVSRGGRPDLAGESLNVVSVPTLLIVGSHDGEVIKLNEWALQQLLNAKIVLVPGATHLFEEPGALQEVVRLTSDWFSMNLDLSRQQQDDLI